MPALIAINIAIADRTYRIKIEQNDEERVRKTIKLINDKILEFKTDFAGKDMQDYIAMVLLWYATQIQSGKDDLAEKTLLEALQKMEAQIDRANQ